MKERPILFAGSMVRALLAGTKTQTRRLLKVQPGPSSCIEDDDGEGFAVSTLGGAGPGHDVDERRANLRCPYGVVGDQLWVRETHALRADVDGTTDPSKARHYAIYRADRDSDDLGAEWHNYGRWRPSIHMPRWASRLTLEITGVRVERLQAITEADAQAEGARRFDDVPDPHPYKQGPRWSMGEPTSTDQCIGSARYAFANLWEKLNGAKLNGANWDANPWVWVVEFRRAGGAE